MKKSKLLSFVLLVSTIVTLCFSGCGGKKDDSGSGKDPVSSVHTPVVHTEAKVADCIHDGNVEYYFCEHCERYYSDAACTQRLDEDNLVIEKDGHNLDAKGECTKCHASVWNGTVATAFSSGEGTAESPYVLNSAAEVAFLSKSVKDGETYEGKFFKLNVDVDLNKKPWTPIGGFDINTQNHLHTREYPFKGTFDGDNHTIFNLVAENNPRLFGFFGCVSYATLKNLKFSDANILANCKTNPEMDKDYNRGAACLCAYALGSATIDNIYIYPSCYLEGHSYVSFVLGNTDPYDDYMDSGEEIDEQTGVAKKEYNWLAVPTDQITITNCVSYGKIFNDQNFAGAMLGGTGGRISIKVTIRNCKNYGEIHGNTYTGGIVGLIRIRINDNAIKPSDPEAFNYVTFKETDMIVDNCYNYGDVIGGGYTGGIIGWNRTTVTNCWCTYNIKLGLKTLEQKCVIGKMGSDDYQISLYGFGDSADSRVGVITGSNDGLATVDYTNCGVCDLEGNPSPEWLAFMETDAYLIEI